MYTGETLKRVRLLKGLNQKGIAKQLGISQPAYCKLEKRKNIDPARLQKILQLMHCNSDELSILEKLL